ncbi:MAG: trypsin-like peptidase domain-containing protein, partial [Acidobacteriota bacterium]
MQPGKRFLVVASVLLSLLADETAARRALSPNQGTVFIRVVGKLRAEYDATWKEFIEEKDMEIGTGSGFVISSYGHVLTNYHVISGRAFSRKVGGIDIRYEMQVQRIEVAFPPGSGRGEESSLAGRFAASVDAVDRELDLALLSVSGADLPYVPLGDSDALAANQPVEVLGFPF